MRGSVIKKICLFAFLVLLFLPLNVYADDDEFLFCDLSLAGYRIGMTYEQAASVRPFDYVEDIEDHRRDYRYYVAVSNGVYLAGEELELWVYFKNDQLQKVLVKFNPVAIDDMVEFFKKTMGPCENKSRVVNRPTGEEVQQYIYKWDFPFAKMHLVGLSSETEFATASLVAKDGVIENEGVN